MHRAKRSMPPTGSHEPSKVMLKGTADIWDPLTGGIVNTRPARPGGHTKPNSQQKQSGSQQTLDLRIIYG